MKLKDTKYPILKMHGCGNDFVVYVDFEEKTTPQQVRKISMTHTGVGADGVITVVRSRTPKAKYRMKYFNADGSFSEMCGNGIRCFAKYLLDNKLVSKKGKIPIDTDAGIIIPEVLENSEKEAIVKVNMGKPSFYNPHQVTLPPNKKGLISVSFKSLLGTFVSMENPHVVFFIKKGKAQKYALDYGSQIENRKSLFPQKTNVEFAEVIDKKNLIVHVWERGAGITLACGTGACATLAAAVVRGYSDTSTNIHLPGGTLEVSWSKKDDPIYMTGPATNVYKIKNLDELY